jgi:predicted transcriptional regulator
MILASGLPASARFVGLVLSTHMDRNGGSCFPSLTTLENETGLSRKTVWTSIDKLEQAGLIERKRSRGRSTRYRALGAPVTYSLGDSGTQLGAQGNELGAPEHPEDVQEDVQKDVHNFSTRAARARKKKGARSGGARPNLSYLDDAGTA